MKNRIALFPGQGAQHVGMAKDFLDNFKFAQERFEEASEIVKVDLAKLCLEGPEDELNSTKICQPALLVSSLVIFEVLEKELGWDHSTYQTMAGLSLGEITALVASGSLTFSDGVRLVHARGSFMQEACEREPSGMASVIGMTREQVQELVDQVPGHEGRLVLANINAPKQIVLSGDLKLLEKISEQIGQAGKRAISLKVAGAFHSPYMKPADDQLTEFMEGISFETPQVPVISNVDAQAHSSAESIKGHLAKQIVSPVLWADSMLSLEEDSVAYELGAGRVLAGLMRKINPKISVTSIETYENFKKLTQQETST